MACRRSTYVSGQKSWISPTKCTGVRGVSEMATAVQIRPSFVVMETTSAYHLSQADIIDAQHSVSTNKINTLFAHANPEHAHMLCAPSYLCSTNANHNWNTVSEPTQRAVFFQTSTSASCACQNHDKIWHSGKTVLKFEQSTHIWTDFFNYCNKMKATSVLISISEARQFSCTSFPQFLSVYLKSMFR